VDQEDSLDSEWATLKEIPSAKALTENVDLRGDYLRMGVYPEFVYRIVDSDYGFKHPRLLHAQGPRVRKPR
jgi:hypothetical protein